MTLLSTWAMAVIASLNMAAMTESKTVSVSSDSPQPFAADTAITTLVITKVKKPWFAWKGLVVGKMRTSIPEYRAIQGLQHKLYSFTSTGKLFGGIYYWKSKQDAEKWFNPSWFERVKNQYGQDGIVEYYEVLKVMQLSEAFTQESKHWCVITHGEMKAKGDVPIQGLEQQALLKDSEGKTAYLTIWKSKADAALFFQNDNGKNEYFQSPLALW